jgi:hypothetical protein
MHKCCVLEAVKSRQRQAWTMLEFEICMQRRHVRTVCDFEPAMHSYLIIENLLQVSLIQIDGRKDWWTMSPWLL